MGVSQQAVSQIIRSLEENLGVRLLDRNPRQSAPTAFGRLLLVHGEGDALIPISQSERVLSFAPRATLLRIPGAAHNDVHQFSTYTDALLETLKSL